MRVLHVLGELQHSGGEVMLRDAVPILRQLGIEPIILATGAQRGAFESAFEEVSVPVLHLPFSRDLAFLRAFRRLVRDQRVAVAHLHTERANAALGIAAATAGARVVRTVHNVFAYAGRLRLQRTAERAALRMLGVRHLSISPSVESNERQRLLNPTHRVDNWVGSAFRPATPDERTDARSAIGLDDASIVLTTIGNCSSVKNHMAVIEALPRLTRELRCPIVYLHAGTGASETEERALAAAQREATIDVRFLGTVRDVRPLLWATDVFCMPSLYEGLPIAALEALACGVPSVLADAPGLRDVHPATESVRLVSPDAPSVAAAVTELVSGGDRTRVHAETVAETVRYERSVERGAAKWAAVYRSL